VTHQLEPGVFLQTGIQFPLEILNQPRKLLRDTCRQL
jgi:hypothetical protein